MKSLQTVDELVYALRDCLTVISTHAQVLLAQQGHRDGTADGLTAIHQAAERAAALLHMVTPTPDAAQQAPSADAGAVASETTSPRKRR
ncbi:MAG: hypothetical protein ACOYOB_14270 [Myxococcota bacterium]